MDKKAIIIGGGLLVAAIALASKKPPADTGGKEIVLHIYDAQGNLVASNSGVDEPSISAFPAGLVEGASYTAVVTVANTSRYPDGTPAPYTFHVGFAAGVNSPVGSYFSGAAGVAKTLNLAAGASGTVSFPFTIPYGMNGAGSAAALLQDAGGAILGQATVTFTVSGATITPGGTIVF